MADDMKSRIAELEKELYAKEFKPHEVEEELARKEAASVPTEWNKEQEAITLAEEQAVAAKHHQMIKKLVYISIGFFAIALAVAALVWFRGSNVISGSKIEVNVDHPVAVAGGEPFDTKFTITNNNKVALEHAVLYVEFPQGFYSATTKTELPRITKDLGTIAPGQATIDSLSTILYGEENAEKEVAVTLEYRMAGSNATLKKTATYAVRISSSPITLKLTAPAQVSSGQEAEFAVEVGSNSQSPQSGLLLDVSYPFGFSFKGADPAPAYGNTTWMVDTLAPQEKRMIKIRGVLEGQESEEKSMRISVGTPSAKDERQIEVAYNTLTQTIAIAKSFLGLSIAMNGDRSPTYAAPLGRGVRVEVAWQSSVPTRVTDATIEVALKGDALNRYSVYADGGGFYRSTDNTIVWDKTANSSLASIEPGQRGSVSFSFAPVTLGVDAGKMIRNPQIGFEVKVRARNAESGDEVTTLATRAVKFNTDLRLMAQSLYYSGPFKNTGALPPRADMPTTYTIKWIVRNGSNNVSAATVKTTLPIYVKWLGVISPSGEDLTYNESGAEVTWNTGRIPAGGTREAAFQISFTPSVSQINKTPYLTGDTTLVATDEFTGASLSDRKAPVTTNLSADPQFSQNQATVIQ